MFFIVFKFSFDEFYVRFTEIPPAVFTNCIFRINSDHREYPSESKHINENVIWNEICHHFLLQLHLLFILFHTVNNSNSLFLSSIFDSLIAFVQNISYTFRREKKKQHNDNGASHFLVFSFFSFMHQNSHSGLILFKMLSIRHHKKNIKTTAAQNKLKNCTKKHTEKLARE